MEPSRRLRHPSSLENIIDFSTKQAPLDLDRRIKATTKFYHIVNHFEEATDARKFWNGSTYNRTALVRLTYEYSRSDESKDTFLRAFLKCTASASASPADDDDINLDDVDLEDVQTETDVRSLLFEFADFLLANFFLPRMVYLFSSHPSVFCSRARWTLLISTC